MSIDYTKKIRSLKYNGVQLPLADGKIEIPVPTGWESKVYYGNQSSYSTLNVYQINNYEFIMTGSESSDGTYYVNIITNELKKIANTGFGSTSAEFIETDDYVFIGGGTNLYKLCVFEKATKNFNEVTLPAQNTSIRKMYFINNNVGIFTGMSTSIGIYKLNITDIDNIEVTDISYRDAGRILTYFWGYGANEILDLGNKLVFWGYDNSSSAPMYKYELNKTTFEITRNVSSFPKYATGTYSSYKTSNKFFLQTGKYLFSYDLNNGTEAIEKEFSNTSQKYIRTIDKVIMGSENKVEESDNFILVTNSTIPSGDVGMWYYDADTDTIRDINTPGISSLSSVYEIKTFLIDDCLFTFPNRSQFTDKSCGKIDLTQTDLSWERDTSTSSGHQYSRYVDYCFNSQNEFYILDLARVLKWNSTTNEFDIVTYKSLEATSGDFARYKYISPRNNSLNNELFITWMNEYNSSGNYGLWYNIETDETGKFNMHGVTSYEETIIDEEYVLITYGNEKAEHRFTNDEYSRTDKAFCIDWSDDGFVPIEDTQPQER